MENLTFKQRVILAIIAGGSAALVAVLSNSGGGNSMTVGGMQINQPMNTYAVSNRGNSSSSISIVNQSNNVVNNSVAAVNGGTVIQGNNIQAVTGIILNK